MCRALLSSTPGHQPSSSESVRRRNRPQGWWMWMAVMRTRTLPDRRGRSQLSRAWSRAWAMTVWPAWFGCTGSGQKVSASR